MPRSLLAVFFLLLLPGASRAELPTPTGPFGIGIRTFDWKDPSRLETQSGKAGEHRELLVYLLYPTDKTADGVRADYFPHLKEIEAFEERFGENFFRKSYGSSYKTIVNLKSHAVENAPLAAGNQKFPLAIFSHGGGIPVLCYTAIVENLVSHGYVVAAVEHTFDGATVMFPDGRIITQSGWDQDDKRSKHERAAFHTERHRTGALDDRFVLDQLERLNAGTLSSAGQEFRDRLDLHRVAALGHSLGGKIATCAGRDDDRFRTCLNLDGGLDTGLTYGSPRHPVVAMFGDNRRPQKPDESAEAFAKRRASQDRFIQNLKAPYAHAPEGSYLLLVDSPAFSHFSYYDFPDNPAELPPWKATPEQWRHNQQIILDSTLAVLDAHLAPTRSSTVDDLLKQHLELRQEPIGGSRSQ